MLRQEIISLPKVFFPKPRPSDLLTVPACQSCNKGSCDEDEIFKVFIGIAGGHGKDGERMFKEQTARTLANNKKLKRELANSIHDLWVKTPEGIILGKRSAIKLDGGAHDKIVEKMIRGFHFHHTGTILGNKVDISVNWHQYLSDEVDSISTNWSTGVIGEGKLIYKYIAIQEEPLASIWIFQFFGRAWSSGTVLPKGIKESRSG